MGLKRLIARLSEYEFTQLVDGDLHEAKPSKNRQNQAGSEIRKGGKASADIFHATDVVLDVTLSLADLRKLIQNQEVTIEARDKKRVSNQSNVYTLKLRYKGKGVPEQ